MQYTVYYSQEAINDLQQVRAYDRSAIVGGIDATLAVNPTMVSKAKVKKLVQPTVAMYRLRVNRFRVLYDVDEADCEVEIVRILEKPDAIQLLAGGP